MRPAAELAERLGLPVTDLDLLEQALVHSSWLHEHPDAARGHNERLEFLGDVVINLAISEALYAAYPTDDEGLLSARRAAIVSTAGLSRLAHRIDLGDVPAPRRGRGPARRTPPAVAPRLGVRGPGRRHLPRPRAGSPPRLADDAGRARARQRLPEPAPQEPQEPPPGVHPAPHRRAPRLPHRRRERPRPREAVPGSRSGSTARPSASARAVAPRGRDRRRAPQALETRSGARAAQRRRRPRRPRRRRGARRRAAPNRPRLSAPARLLALRVHGFKSFAERTLRRVRRRHQRRRRAERVGQEQPRRRAALGPRRAGPGAPHAQVGGRDLRRLGQAPRRSAWPT